MNDMGGGTFCGFVALVGRPNVGKSSLLNALLGKKISITSFRPQTTRHQIMGIKTEGKKQIVYVDTPGLHHHAKKALNRHMNKVVHQALIDVNVILFVIEALKWTSEDSMVCDLLQERECPIIVVLNKIDLLSEKEKLLAWMSTIAQRLPLAEYVPVSCKKQIQIEKIEQLIQTHLPPSPFYFAEHQSMNHSESFHVAEIIREKTMRLLDKELPYSICVEVETMTAYPHCHHINALIWVERESQKAIAIGKEGAQLRAIGVAARKTLEQFYEKQVYLKLWVKVKESWSDNERALQSLGF